MDAESAIKKIDSPCVVMAGAGTGKTHLMVEKVSYLIKNKIFPPEKIVCITFSNEAANSLSSRIRKSIEGFMPNVKTFHAFSAQLIRDHSTTIGVDKDFEIMTPEEAKILLHRNLKISPKNCHRYVEAISKLKDFSISQSKLDNYIKEKIGDISIEELSSQIENSMINSHIQGNSKEQNSSIENKKKFLELKKFSRAWSAYEKIKTFRKYLDYSDLNGLSLEVLKKDKSISEKFGYFIVDEFQDTSKPQLEFLLEIAPRGNLTLVGDMNQSIYQFRGAYKKNLEILKKNFSVKENDIFRLDKSRRSKNRVLRCAHKLILNNYIKKEECFPVMNNENIEGEKVKVYETLTAEQEARKVSEIVFEIHTSGIPLEEICIMYRTHEQGKLIKLALESKSVKYNSLSKNSLTKKNHIKELINYLSIYASLQKKSIASQRNWWDLVHQKEFPDSDLIKMGKFLKDNIESENFGAKILNSLELLELSPEGKIKAKSICDRIKLLLANESKNLPEKIKLGCEIILSEKDNLEVEEITDVGKFEEFAKNTSRKNQINDLDGFLHYLSSLEALEIKIDSADVSRNGVKLMTSHASKGLEYTAVIVTNLSEGKFPVTRTYNNSLIPPELLPTEEEDQISEERRLCYVAFTRAKEKLILTYAKNYGQKSSSPSRFLEEIEYRKNPDIEFLQDFQEKELLIQTKKTNPSEKIMEKKSYSPTSLITFEECQKKFEYKYVYNMPDKFDDFENLKLGSFIHLVLEQGVKNNFSTVKEFFDLSEDLMQKEEWASLDKTEISLMIKTFFERNKNKFDNNSLTEYPLPLELEGLNFIGFADRIDIKNNFAEIIDYKTGKTQITAKNRNYQLGYYALAAEKLCPVKKVTLEMLRQDKSLEFVRDENSNFKDINSDRTKFSLPEVKSQIMETARKIKIAYKNGFTPCPLQKNCDFCNEHVYRI